MRSRKEFEFFQDRLPKFLDQGYLPIIGDLDSDLAQLFLEGIVLAQEKGLKELTLLINSNGGRDETFVAIKGAMLQSGIRFKAVVFGNARSNAFRLLQLEVIEHRSAVADSELLFHWGHYTLPNNFLAEMIDAFYSRKDSRAIELVLRRSIRFLKQISKRTGLTEEELIERAKFELPWDAEQALQLNLLHEILPEIPPALANLLDEQAANT